MRDQAIWLTVRQAMLMVCDAIERWYYLNSNGRVKDAVRPIGNTAVRPSDQSEEATKIKSTK